MKSKIKSLILVVLTSVFADAAFADKFEAYYEVPSADQNVVKNQYNIFKMPYVAHVGGRPGNEKFVATLPLELTGNQVVVRFSTKAITNEMRYRFAGNAYTPKFDKAKSHVALGGKFAGDELNARTLVADLFEADPIGYIYVYRTRDH